MSVSAAKEAAGPEAAATIRTDTLAQSVFLLMTMTVVQRAVGFLRSMLYCRLLPDEQLGHWDMVQGFLTLAAPLVVLGLPGSYGRYVEYYRRRGQLKEFLVRTLRITAFSAAAGGLALHLAAPWFARLLFQSEADAGLVRLTAWTLLALVAFNILSELFAALRFYRYSQWLQFLNSLLFAGLSVGLLLVWENASQAIVIGFGLSCAAALALGLVWLRRVWRQIPESTERLPRGELWIRVAPFAAWVWLANYLSNLFDTIDRYLIVHCSGWSESAAMAALGQYHSARVIPLVLVSVAALLGGMILPHLAHDWEGGQQGLVRRRINLGLKLLGLGLCAASLLVMLGAPWLFNVVFKGKYSEGLQLLPLTLAGAVWMGLAALADKYLWCAERTRWSCLAHLVGLIANVALVLFLLTRFGLVGAVAGTGLASLLTVVALYLLSSLLGGRMDGGVWIVTLLPFALACGPAVGAAALAVCVALCCFTRLLLDPTEKTMIVAQAVRLGERLRGLAARRT